MVKYRGHARRYNYWRITRNCYDRCRVLLLGTIIVLILTCISIVSYSGAYSAMRFHISVQNIGEILDAFDVWKNIFNCASLHVITTTWCNLCDCKSFCSKLFYFQLLVLDQNQICFISILRLFQYEQEWKSMGLHCIGCHL